MLLSPVAYLDVPGLAEEVVQLPHLAQHVLEGEGEEA